MPSDSIYPQAQKKALIKALNERRVNTIGELRRIERLFATMASEDVTQPMTSACMDYPSAQTSPRAFALTPPQGSTT